MTRQSEALAATLCAGLALGACGDAGDRGVRTQDGAGLLSAGGRRTYATASHTCAIADGAVRCWGAADRGQTGDGSLSRRRPLPAPLKVGSPALERPQTYSRARTRAIGQREADRTTG